MADSGRTIGEPYVNRGPQEARPSKRVSDPELQAIASVSDAINDALEGLDEPAKSRVLWYVGQRWFGQKEANGNV